MESEKDKLLWKEAKRRVGFKNHLLTYLAVNIFFFKHNIYSQNWNIMFYKNRGQISISIFSEAISHISPFLICTNYFSSGGGFLYKIILVL